jgi:hypothetical protein
MDTTNDLAKKIAAEIKPLLTARWLKLKDAAAYSSIGKSRLIELAGQGIITGFSDPDSKRGDWIFDKYSLDEYRTNQAGRLRRKALDLCRRHQI